MTDQLVKFVARMTPDAPTLDNPIICTFVRAGGDSFKRAMLPAEADTFELGKFCAESVALAAGFDPPAAPAGMN